jgi:hypothetical protein
MNSTIHAFLRAVRARLNQSLALRSLLAALLTGAVAAILWALAWRAFGYAAPQWGYALIAAATALGFAVRFFLIRRTLNHSAAFADHHFRLKDAITSFLDFHSRPEHDAPIYQLQQQAVEAALTDKDPRAIPLAIHRRRVWLALALLLAAIGLAWLPHSRAVQDELRGQQLTLDRSTEIQTELAKAVEEIIAQMSENERDLLKPETLRAWVKEIDPTKDQRDLMKQIARFEQKISASLTGLEARKDEEILKLAAAELSESPLSDAKQLGKKLDDKDFEDAKQQLTDLKPEAAKPLTPEEMKKLLEKSAKLKELSRRMAKGARKRDFGKAPNKAQPNKPNADAKEMDEMLADLEQAANAADQDLQDLDPADPADAGKLEKLDDKLGQLGQRLGKLGAKEKARARMKALGKCAGQAQQFASGQTQALGLAQLGGLKPGTGHSDAKRKDQDAANDNQNFAQLNGQQGEGESKSSVEAADSGTGITGRGASEKSRDFRKQAESLVHRDDVPEDLKQGIREYFQRVHETDNESTKP